MQAVKKVTTIFIAIILLFSNSGILSTSFAEMDSNNSTVSVSFTQLLEIVNETGMEISVAFSESVIGVDASDFRANYGTIERVSGSGNTYTLVYKPNSNIHVTDKIELISDSLSTGIINGGGPITLSGPVESAEFTVNTLKPYLKEPIQLNRVSFKAGDTGTVTFTFNDPITGFTNTNLTVQGGSLGNLSTSDGTIWTATFTPTSNYQSATNVITLSYTGIQNAAGNLGTGTETSANFIVDTTIPTATITIDKTQVKADETAEVTIEFSEAVPELSLASFQVANGTLTDPTTADNGTTWTTIFQPDADHSSLSNVIVVSGDTVANATGNIANGMSWSTVPFSINTIRPTVQINIDESLLSRGKTALVTFTFSEPIPNFDVQAVTVENGTLSNLVTADLGKTWTATLTPANNVNAPSNVITVNNEQIINAVGNKGQGTTASNRYSVNTKVAPPSSYQPSLPPFSIDFVNTNEDGAYEGTMSYEQALQLISSLSAGQQLTINFPSATNESDARLTMMGQAINEIARRGIDLSVKTGRVHLNVPAASLKNVNENLYFYITPGVENVNTLSEAKQNAEVQRLMPNRAVITTLGKSVEINTNLQRQPVTLTMPIEVDLTEDQLATILIYVEHSDGTVEVIKGKIVEENGGKAIQFSVQHFSTFTLIYASEIEAEPTPTEPEKILIAPYISGFEDHTFRPNAAVTRAQMAMMLARFKTNNNIPVVAPTFIDTNTSFAKDAIEFVKSMGLFAGETVSTFNPEGEMTRGEMAAVVVRWVERACKEDGTQSYCFNKAPKTFKDVNNNHWAAASIQKATAFGIMKGTSTNSFEPNRTLTRAEAVRVLNQLFNRPVEVNPLTSSFKDVPKTHWAHAEIEAAVNEIEK